MNVLKLTTKMPNKKIGNNMYTYIFGFTFSFDVCLVILRAEGGLRGS